MNKKNHTPLLIILFAITVVGIVMIFKTSVYSTLIPNNHNEWSIKLDKVIYQLPQNDQTLLQDYLNRHNPEYNKSLKIETLPLNLSISRAIQIQKDYLTTSQAVTDKIEENKQKNYDNIKNKIKSSLFVTYLGKENIDNTININLVVKNKSNSVITSFVASVDFMDINGNILENITINEEGKYTPNETTTIIHQYKKEDLNNFELVKNMSSQELDFHITIKNIIFQDGEKLTLAVQ